MNDQSNFEVGDVVVAVSGIEGPPEAVGIGIVINTHSDNIWKYSSPYVTVFWSKIRKTWDHYPDDLKLIKTDTTS